MKPEDWDQMRVQRQNTEKIFAEGCPKPLEKSVYTYFPADITIDNEKFTRVGVRKKGLLGSQSSSKPSIKVKFLEYDQTRLFKGAKRLTLNNNKQDPSLIKQCFTYQLFAEAGLPSSRCNFAHVYVNGQDLGIYSNVEPIKKPFLKRNYQNDSGNLYEGTIADFRPQWIAHFEKKTNEQENDWKDIDKMVEALQVPDEELLKKLEPILDIDAFIKYWAMEVLTGHWDSYNGNNNNFYVYRHPVSNKFYFIPWGVDGTMNNFIQFMQPLMETKPPKSVLAHSILSRRLYNLPETRSKYVKQLLSLVDEIWDDKALIAESARMEELLTPHLVPKVANIFKESLKKVNKFITSRKSVIHKEMDGDSPPRWEFPLRKIPCIGMAGEASVTFSTTWADKQPKDPMTSGQGTFNVSYINKDYKAFMVGASAHPAEPPDDKDKATIIVPGVVGENYKIFLILVTLPKNLVKKGNKVPFMSGKAEGMFLFLGWVAPGTPQLLGHLGLGEIVFGEASTTKGEKIEATIKTGVFRLGG